MTIEEAIRTLDEVIPPPKNPMVDIAQLRIAVAWAKIREEIIGNTRDEEVKK